MQRTYIKDIESKKGETIVIKAWVDIRRDQGKLIFLDFRDMTGYVQGVVLPSKTEEGIATMAMASKLRPEWVVEITGKVNPRPEKNVQKDKQNGSIELEVIGIKVINEAVTPPIDVRSEGKDIGEESRLTYRYLDLRRPRLQKNFRVRHAVNMFVRNWLTKEGFTEIETPLLTKFTHDGARGFLVPSRLENGKFYALPQSPQQYKQLLMVSGFEKYFQIARCLRDEDSRGDRQPEFTQLDMEMSFVEREDVMALNEKLLIDLVQTVAPHKKIQAIPFPRMTYKEAMEKYNSDKPDIRTDKNDPDLLAFCWVTDFPFFEKTDTGAWTFSHNPFSAPKPEHMDMLMKKENVGEILTSQYDIALNGFEVGGGSVRNHQPEALRKVLEIMGYDEEKIKSGFGHMLEALGYGAPSHGGIAWGLDRLMAILQNEPNIREVIAFAKTGEGRDLMMESPSPVSNEQLIELGIVVKKKA
ncbi:MAG: aspartyl-tRNA synthetase, aspartyl-tRNA synthetase [Candidatus Parcubacteria bacterium]|jgi:aspartyl-tRNA synthetase